MSALVAVASLLAGCATDDVGDVGDWRKDPGLPGAVVANLPTGITVASDVPAELALIASQTIFAAAPAVVLVEDGDPEAEAAAAEAADEVDGPVLAVGGVISDDGLRIELERLGATGVLVVGDVEDATLRSIAPAATAVRLKSSWAAGTPTGDTEIAGAIAQLPERGKPQQATEAVALVDPDADEDVTLAVATARAAGAVVIEVPGGDPRASHASVDALANAQALSAIGIGTTFGSSSQLAARFRAASTGVELPGGGQLVTGSRYVGLAGSPVSPSLGALGRQDVDATVTRAAEVAGAVDPDAVPTLEIAATVAAPAAGEDGDFSNETPADELRPLVEAGLAAGQSVVLDFQPGGSTFVEQLAEYRDLLDLPGVGVALDLEWRYPDGAPGGLVAGRVPAAEVDEALAYLADVVVDGALPQKLVVLRDDATPSVDDPGALDLQRDPLGVVVSLPGDVDAPAWSTAADDVMAGVRLTLPSWGLPAAADDGTPAYVVYR
ncbi:hypothetical protein [Sediminihabitans luteus]|uniref:hypothetical protein n=1 Tax=Sediminihabitans luteus TaxID=1138585 RepID=UPI0012FD55A5|nr:hypothetical protein [Sediminihabitans luteus]